MKKLQQPKINVELRDKLKEIDKKGV